MKGKESRVIYDSQEQTNHRLIVLKNHFFKMKKQALTFNKLSKIKYDF